MTTGIHTMWFAQAPAPQAPAWASLVMPIGILAICYFIVIRPQLKQRREHQTTIRALKKHDEVVTMGGLHGTIINVKESTVVVRLDEHAKAEIDRDAIARVKGSQHA